MVIYEVVDESRRQYFDDETKALKYAKDLVPARSITVSLIRISNSLSRIRLLNRSFGNVRREEIWYYGS